MNLPKPCAICKGAGVMGTKSPKMPEAPCICTWPPDVTAYIIDVFLATLAASSERTEDWLTTGPAGRALGLTSAQVRRWCEQGKIPGAEQHFGWWRIPPQTIELMLERRRKRIDSILGASSESPEVDGTA